MFRTPLGQRQCGVVTAAADSDTLAVGGSDILAVASDTSVDLALGTSVLPPATPLSIRLTDVSLFTGFPGVLLFTGFPDVWSSFAASIGVLSSWVPQYMLTAVGVHGYATARS